ncbi:hypothetical protein ACPA9J_23595 [Pseudomonas aeruginosa]
MLEIEEDLVEEVARVWRLQQHLDAAPVQAGLIMGTHRSVGPVAEARKNAAGTTKAIAAITALC